MSTRPETRKWLDLPSGARVKIRRLSIYDVMLAEQPPKNATEAQRIAAGLSLVKIILTRCTAEIRHADGTRQRIVDKHFKDCGDDELSVEELDQADADKINAEVHAISDLGKGAGEQPKPFPENSSSERPPASADLPQAAD